MQGRENIFFMCFKKLGKHTESSYIKKLEPAFSELAPLRGARCQRGAPTRRASA